MTLAVPAPFAEVLLANRERFNYRFAEARRARPRLDADVFKDLLRFSVAPLVEVVHQMAPARTTEVGEALYDLALDLLGQDLLGPGARYPAVAIGWGTLLPRLGRFLAEAPRPVAGAVTNALYHLARTPDARPEAWTAAMLQLATVCADAATLLRAGQVAAWGAGLAHFRAAALEIARRLPAPVARAALGLAASAEPVQSLVDRLAADPWLAPAAAERPVGQRAPAIVARVGAFRGFGGLFLRPPIVEAADRHFLVSDGEGVWLLTADVCGATFHRVAGVPTTRPDAAFALAKDGSVRAGGQSVRFPELADASSQAAGPQTLAVTTPLSHAVVLVALTAV